MGYDETLLVKCIVVEVIIASIIAIATVLSYGQVVSPLFAFSFFIPLIYIFRKIKSFSKELLLLTVLCLLHVWFSGMICGGALNFNYFKKVIMFLSFAYLAYYAVNVNSCNEKLLNLIKLFPVISGIVMVVAYFFLGKTEMRGGGITLGFSNPNAAGIWLLHLILYGFLYVLECSEKKARLLYIPIIIALLILLDLTKARSCYIALVFFGVVLFLGILGIQVNKFMCFAVVLIPLIFTFFYMNIVDSNWVQTEFAFMISEGKPLTSRMAIWNDAFEAIREHFFLGDYCGISDGTGMSQLHNTHLDVLSSYGIVPFILFIKILYKSTLKTLEKANGVYKYAAFASFCAVLIMGTIEAAIVSGSMGLNLLTIGFIVLGTADVNNDKSEEKDGKHLKPRRRII